MENKDPSVLQSDWIIQKYANLNTGIDGARLSHTHKQLTVVQSKQQSGSI